MGGVRSWKQELSMVRIEDEVLFSEQLNGDVIKRR